MGSPKSFRPVEDRRGNLYFKIDIERARKVIAEILDDPEYLRQLKRRALGGVLAPAVEIMLWHYMYGKPAENVNVDVTYKKEDLSKLSDSELAARAKVLSEQILAEAEVPQLPPGSREN